MLDSLVRVTRRVEQSKPTLKSQIYLGITRVSMTSTVDCSVK